MKAPRPPKQWTVGASAVLALLAGGGFYYWVKVGANEEYLKERNYRLVSSASRQVQDLTRLFGRMASRDVREACGRALGRKPRVGDEDTCREAIAELERGPLDPGLIGPRRAQPAAGPDVQLPGRKAASPSQRQAARDGGREEARPLPARLEAALADKLEERRTQARRRWAGTGSRAFFEFESSTLAIGPLSATSRCPAGVSSRPVTPSEPGTLLHVDRRSGQDCALSVETRGRVDFESIFSPFLKVFDMMGVLDDQRRALATVPRELPLDVLAAEPPVGPDAKRAGADPPTGPAAGAAGPVVPEKVAAVTVADREYLVFCRPLAAEEGLSFDVAGIRRGRMVCGLVGSDRFDTEAVALNPYWLVAIGSLLALGMLSWPFLKLVSLGQGERLRPYDLAFTTTAVIAAAALTTLLVLDLTSYLAAEKAEEPVQAGWARACFGGEADTGAAQDLRAQLGRLAGCVASNVEAELRDLRATLFAFERGFDPEGLRPLLDNRQAVLGQRLGRPDGARVPYPFFTSLFWIDETGRQRIRWASEGRGPLLHLHDRAYFRNAVADRLWVAEGEQAGSYLEPVQSRTTGVLSLVLSTRTSPVASASGAVPAGEQREPGARAEGEPGQKWVIALGARPFSLIAPVLPPGFGFALIAPDGRTLFHSGRDHLAEEDFFEECDRSPRLLAAVSSRTKDVFPARYWGRDHLLHVSPLRGMPLHLVVFFEKDLVRTAHLELLSVCLVALVGLLAALALQAALARGLVGPGSRLWLWPRSEATALYVTLSILLLGMGLELVQAASAPADPRLRLIEAYALPLAAVALVVSVLGRSASATRRSAAVLVLVGLPLAAVVAAAPDPRAAGVVPALVLVASLGLALGQERLRTGPVRAEVTGRAYVIWALAALFAVAVAPAYAFFRLAWEREARLYVRHGQLDLAHRLDERERTLPRSKGDDVPQPWDEALQASGEDWERCRPGRVGVRGSCNTRGYDALYASHFYDTDVSDSEIPVPGSKSGEPPPPSTRGGFGWLDSLAGALPYYNGFSTRLRGMAKSAAEDKTWRSDEEEELQGARRARLTLIARRAGGDKAYAVHSTVPRFRVLDCPAPWLALLGVAAAVAGLVRFLLQRLFLLGFREPRTASLEDPSFPPLSGHHFVVCPPLGCRRALRSRPDVRVEDLASGVPSASSLQAIPDRGARPRALCLDRFDLALPDPATRRALLELLEALVDDASLPVLVFSELEPEEVLAFDDAQRRWTRLLGRFQRIVAVDAGDPAGFETRLQAVEKDHRRRWAGTRDAARLARLGELLDVLRAECGRHRQLQLIGASLAALPDFARHDADGLVVEVRRRADGYYRALWSSLTSCEKLLLAQVASGHFVNPRSGTTLSRLLARGLLVPEVGFRIVNRSFARFVMGEARPEQVALWERSAAAGLWSLLRAPVMIGLLGAAGLLAFTQGDALSSYLTATGAAVPLLVKIVDLLRSAPALASAAGQRASA